MAFALDRATIADWSMFGKGLIRGEALQDFVNQAVKNRPIEGLNIPFACVATRVDTGQAVLFQRGNVGQAVRASSSVPGVFQPEVICGVEIGRECGGESVYQTVCMSMVGEYIK